MNRLVQLIRNFYLYKLPKILPDQYFLNKNKILHQKVSFYSRLHILHKWINFVQTLISERHQNYLNHQRTIVAEFHYILSQSLISDLTHNTGCPDVVRPFSQPSLRRLADSPQDCHPPRVGEGST